jgi:hypothetical protein
MHFFLNIGRSKSIFVLIVSLFSSVLYRFKILIDKSFFISFEFVYDCWNFGPVTILVSAANDLTPVTTFYYKMAFILHESSFCYKLFTIIIDQNVP